MAQTREIINAATLKDAADQALRSGNPAVAAELFERAVGLAPERIDLAMGLAASRRAQGEGRLALQAIELALTIEPRFFPALLMKGSVLEQFGETAAAAVSYGLASQLAPPHEALAPSTRQALSHAREVHERHTKGLLDALLSEAKVDASGADASLARRATAFAETVAGRRKAFRQEPVQFNFPGLPAIEFYDRAEFPWLEDLEVHARDIREEVLAVWGESSVDLEPYIDYAPGQPVDQWAELNHSLRWSAFHLLRDGSPVEANAARCPRTMQALEAIDQPCIAGRSPAAMFSILRPRTRIPPHTGVSNARLVLHLPLIVPPDCGFRVGGETRAWREGEAWVFDDTINHEAWNDSDSPRAILICDLWSPRLSAEERDLVQRLTAVLDRYNGRSVAGSAL